MFCIKLNVCLSASDCRYLLFYLMEKQIFNLKLTVEFCLFFSMFLFVAVRITTALHTEFKLNDVVILLNEHNWVV